MLKKEAINTKKNVIAKFSFNKPELHNCKLGQQKNTKTTGISILGKRFNSSFDKYTDEKKLRTDK
ncbi:MAG: hypothetical protein U0V72_04805 [Cytophagales bacterium]